MVEGAGGIIGGGGAKEFGVCFLEGHHSLKIIIAERGGHKSFSSLSQLFLKTK